MIAHLAIALLLATGAAAATDSAATTSALLAKKEKPKKICKANVKSTGTRISKPVCKTEEEWAEGETGMDLHTRGKAGNPEPLCMLCKADP